MEFTRRQGALFASGLALAGLAAAYFVMGDKERVRSGSAPSTQILGGSAQPDAVQLAAPSTRTTSCNFEPILAAGAEDGQLRLPASLAGKTAGSAAELLVTGKEAVAAGRPRDAEVAFLGSCRIAAQREDKDVAAVADAKYQLGRHYAALATLGAPRRADMLRRAEALYSDSLVVYLDRHGKQAEKTRFASNGLTAVRQAAGSSTPPVAMAQQMPVPAPRRAEAPPAIVAKPQPPVVVARPAPPVVVATPAPPVVPTPAPPVMAVAKPAAPVVAPKPAAPVVAARQAPERVVVAPPVAVETQQPARPPVRTVTRTLPPAQASGSATEGAVARPSFDCSRARSTSERLICGDAELATLDRNLGRLHSRAREAAADPRDFKRRSDREWLEREANCRDRECLRDWYAQRRQQLSSEISQAEGSPNALER